MDVWGPARVRGQGHERYCLLVVDDYSRYTTVFPLRRKGEVTEVLIDWIRSARHQLSESFGSDLSVLRLHSDRGASPQQNGIAERCIGMLMDVARTSMIHAAAPHFLWPFAVQYAAHQINLQPRVSLPETTPILRWTGKVGDTSVFRVWGSRAFVRDTSADKLSSRAVDPVELVEVAVNSGAARGAEPTGAGPEGAVPGVAESEGAVPGGAEPERVEPGGAEPGGVERGGAEPERAESGGPPPTGPAAGGAFGAGAAGGAAGARAAGAAGPGGIGVVGGPAGVGAAGGSRAAGPGGARSGGTRAAGAGVATRVGAVGACAVATGGATGAGAAEGTGAGGAAGVVVGDPGAEGPSAVSFVSSGAAWPRPYYVPLLQQPASPLPGPSPYSGPTRGLTENHELESRPALPNSRPASLESCPKSPVHAFRTGRRVPRQGPTPIPGTHSMTLRPSTTPQRVPLPSPPASSLPAGPDPESDSLRAAIPTVTRFQATAVIDPWLHWVVSCWTTLPALGFAPSTADPSLFLHIDTTLPPFYVIVYVDDLVFATADTEALAHVKFELQKRQMCTDMGELTSNLGLRVTWDRAQRTITLTQSHMVQQVLRRFGFTYSSPHSTPLPTGHSLSAPPSDESVEPSGPYPEHMGCLMYLMTCTRPDLAYPLSILARYVAPGRHRKEHMDAAKRVLRYLCSSSGMGLVLGGRARVVLTCHADASKVDDLATQRSSQGYTFSLGSGSVSWRSTCSSSVLSSSCEAGIYTGAMAAQELRWLTYLLTDLGEAPRSPPVLYVDNKAMLALCQEHKLEHRAKRIALRYFLARELQQRGQLHLAYVATRANTAFIFTKARQPCDHQCFCTMLGLVPTWPHLLTS
ncbi:unnamed protein product [Closterium sp. NIES-54]